MENRTEKTAKPHRECRAEREARLRWEKSDNPAIFNIDVMVEIQKELYEHNDRLFEKIPSFSPLSKVTIARLQDILAAPVGYAYTREDGVTKLVLPPHYPVYCGLLNGISVYLRNCAILARDIGGFDMAKHFLIAMMPFEKRSNTRLEATFDEDEIAQFIDELRTGEKEMLAGFYINSLPSYKDVAARYNKAVHPERVKGK